MSDLSSPTTTVISGMGTRLNKKKTRKRSPPKADNSLEYISSNSDFQIEGIFKHDDKHMMIKEKFFKRQDSLHYQNLELDPTESKFNFLTVSEMADPSIALEREKLEKRQLIDSQKEERLM
jgi:hypothetical protein